MRSNNRHLDELERLTNGREHYGTLSSSISSSEINGNTSSNGNIKKIINSDAIQLTTNILHNTTNGTNTTVTDTALYSNQILIAKLFTRNQSSLQSNLYPKTMPNQPPEKRFKRHRATNFRRLNDFRHWWKTSRLLVRIAGTLILFSQLYDWTTLLPKLIQHKKSGLKNALKAMKALGRGGPNRSFLQTVHPFTRTVRLYMAIMRGMEARVDHRFWEVLIAEAMAFMGNRSLRWWARHLVDWTSEFWIFPLFVVLVDEEWEYAGMVWKIVILVMGLLRGILPFMFSFVGSRIGRSTALAASDRMNYRWKTVQYVQDFVVSAGTHRPTLDDSALLLHATNIATAIGDGKDPVNVRDNLSYLGFEIIGTGAGGYALYRSIEYEDQGTTLHLHLTPYGPSILDEIPRYILLERKSVDSISSYHSHEFCTIARMKTDAVLKGFSFSGAFFTFQEWAALKTRHDNELLSFNMACKYMCHKSNSFHAVDHYSPPKDLLSLKTFIRTGQVPKKKKKSNTQWAQVMKQLDELSKKLIHMEREGIAPNGVIIYMEGLDCAGKSSTGGLIMQALEDAGYDMSSHRYNRPPTVEERTKPWMWRFKQPAIMLEGKKIKKSALVWDRGPAGDFVYGNLNDLPQELKLQRYVDFHKFEEDCISNGIIFCKLLFVTSKDSIAKTLGKRLAHKKIVGDLHTWLDANSTNHSEKEGLQEIENHIDPTDFIAVNNYDYNKKIFHEFVLHTDHIGRLHSNSHNALCDYFPWLIINTSDRHRARIQIMKSFEKQLDQYAKSMYSNSTTSNMISDGSVGSSAETDEDFERLLMDPRQPFEHGCKENPGKILVALKESFIYMLVMLIIAGSYLHQTWKIGF